jgi:tryptophan synthase beta subunit
MGNSFGGGRGSVLAYGSYTQRDPIMFDGREFSAVSLNESAEGLVPGGSGNIPGTRTGLTQTQLGQLQGATSFQQARQSGGLNTPGTDPAACIVPDNARLEVW